MPSIFKFPLEIEEIILGFLAKDDKRHSALKTCSLVCQAFLPICRKHIFESIVLVDHDLKYLSSTRAFERLIRKKPEIADYIRKLDYRVQTVDPSIQDSLKRISRLEFLTVQHHTFHGISTISSSFNWSDNPIRPALLHLLHLPTLTHFQMDRMNDFVLWDLIPCVNLKYLDIGVYTTVAAETTLHEALPEHSIQLNEFLVGLRSSAAIMKLCTARRPDGKPIIDFGSLSKVTITFEMPDEGEASEELFRHCHALTDVNITFLDPRNVWPSLADMLRPSMRTLKHIVVNNHVDGVDIDPLFGIPSELDDMRTKNIIETVTIGIVVETNANYRRGDDWGRLDEVLTAPGWFSLKRVSLAIEISSYLMWGKELEMTQFPRLSSSNSVSFNFEVNRILV